MTGKTIVTPYDSGKVAYLLRELGIPPHVVGYDYLVEAIKLGLEDHKILHRITKGLYIDIAKKYETTTSRVERAMRHAIIFAFDNGDSELLHSIFGNTISRNTGKVTNQHFIAAIVTILESEPNHPIFKGSVYAARPATSIWR